MLKEEDQKVKILTMMKIQRNKEKEKKESLGESSMKNTKLVWNNSPKKGLKILEIFSTKKSHTKNMMKKIQKILEIFQIEKDLT